LQGATDNLSFSSDKVGVGNIFNMSTDGVTAIRFAATQVASANANTLDDYEEGTFNPVITNAAGSTNVTLTGAGIYKKIGTFVYIQINSYNILVTAFGATEHLYISGLPFQSQTSIYATAFFIYPAQPVSLIDGGTNTKFPLYVPSTSIDYTPFTRNTWGGATNVSLRGMFCYGAIN
jgi:hypothetical protein